MPQATGIHVGRKRIVAVALRGSSRSSRVIGAGSCPRPEDPAALGSTVRALCAERGLPRDPTVLALGNDLALMRTLALPFTSPDQIRKVLKGEAEAAFAGLSVEQMALGSHFLGATDHEGRVLAVAVRKEALASILGELGGGGIDPIAVGLEGFALANALVALGHAPEQGSLVAIECEPDEARFLVLQDRRVRVARTVPLALGAPNVPLGAPADGAVEFDPGVPAPDRGLGCAPEALPELSAELTRTLLAGGLMEPPDRVLLLGPLAHDPALAAAVERVTGVAAEVADLLADAGAPGPDAASAGTAYGAALKGLGFDHDEVNLRVDELAFKRRFDQVAGPLATFVTLAFVVLLVMLIDVRGRAEALRHGWTKQVLAPAYQRFSVVRDRMVPDEATRKAMDDAMRNESKTPRESLMETMAARLDAWEKKLKGGPALDTFKMRSALDTWRNWADRLEAARGKLKPKYWILDGIEVELRPAPVAGTITCAGWLDMDGGREFVEAMKNSLMEVPDFQLTVPGQTQAGTGPDGDQRLQFSLATNLPVEQPEKRKAGTDG